VIDFTSDDGCRGMFFYQCINVCFCSVAIQTRSYDRHGRTMNILLTRFFKTAVVELLFIRPKDRIMLWRKLSVCPFVCPSVR